MKAAYFPHDFGARTDPKLQEVLMEHGVAGIGIYWCIVEMMYEQGGELPLRNIKSIAFNLHADVSMVASIVNDFGLFAVDEEKFYSQSLKLRIHNISERSAKATASVKARWDKVKAEKEMVSNTNAEQTQYERNTNVCENDTNVIRTQYERNTNKINKNKIKENNIDNIDKPVSRFIPPTLQEVEAYIQEKGYNFTAEAFFDYYTSNGWMVGRNKMKDWKASVRNWKRNEHIYGTQHKTSHSASHEDAKREFAETAMRVTERFMRGEG